MQSLTNRAEAKTAVETALQSLGRRRSLSLEFPDALEARFEADTRKARSHRMWFEGLLAILGFNFCLLLDYLFVHDVASQSVVRNIAFVIPVALGANLVVLRNPPGWLREGSVAASMVIICMINLVAEGTSNTSSTLFGEICVLITALFVGAVMRLRFPYALGSISAMLLAGLWSLGHGQGIRLSESAMGSSMMLVGIGIILVASHSLEREERRGYLLRLQRDLQAEELALTNESLQQLSTVDKLTGLPNRRALEERFDLMWDEYRETGAAVSAVVIDVDHFKMVNDKYGHLFGDETLRRIGVLLPQALRSPADMAARFGGEEFILLLAHTEANIALSVAERARQLVEAAGTPLHADPKHEMSIWVTVSCGVSSCEPANGMSWTDLIAAADEALYAAKRGGRNRVEFAFCDARQAHAATSPEAQDGPVAFSF